MEIKEKEIIEELGINDLKIIQNKDYFRFGTDSVLLANFAKSNKFNNNIIDLCSGSGIIPIVFQTKNKFKDIISIEYQKEMFKLLEKNIEINNLNIVPVNENIKNIKKIKKILQKKIEKETVNIITVNPPYKKINTGIKNENDIKFNAKHESLCTLEDIFKTSSSLLENKGKLYIVHKPDRIVELLAIARKYNLEAKRIKFIYPKLELKPSIILIEYTKNGGEECIIEKPLIQYDNYGNTTKEFKDFIS